jgi:RNA polymerase sigma factor (sigma-70 family)
MATRSEQLLLRIRRLVSRPASPSDSDAALLGQFVGHHDQDAFATLVRRHGPLVLGVCHRVLGDAHAAEDAAQAVFLVLARKAATIRPPDRLAAWLHGVARHLASNARRADARRQRQQIRCARRALARPPDNPLDELTAHELLNILDEELQRLPEVDRLPLILCCLEGRTQDEAARQLGWTPGSVKGRLERGRAELHRRLVRRGVSLPATLLALEAVQGLSSASGIPMGFVTSTLRMAASFTASRAVADGGLAEGVPALAEEGLGSLTVAKAKIITTLLLAAGVAAAGAGTLVYEMLAARQPEVHQPAQPKPGASKAELLSVPKEMEQAHADRFGDPLPHNAIQRLGSVRLRHSISVRSVAFSPDGKLLASGDFDQFIRVWNPTTGQETLQIAAPMKRVCAIAFAPDGKLLAGAGPEFVGLCDLTTDRGLRRLEGRLRGDVNAIAFSPRGDLLGAGDAETFWLWELASSKVLRSYPMNKGVYAVTFSPDGRTVAAVDGEATVMIYETVNGKLVRKLPGGKEPITSIVFSKDGKHVFTLGFNDSVWDAASGEKLGPLAAGASGGGGPTAFSSDGKLLAVAGADQGIRLWDRDAHRVVRTLPRHAGQVRALAFSPDDRTLASASEGSLIHLWDVATGEPHAAFAGHREWLVSLAYSPDGRMVATAGWDGTVRLWDARTGKEVSRWKMDAQERQFPMVDSASLGGVTFSSDGKFIAVVRGGEVAVIRDVTTGKNVHLLRASCVAFSPDGKLVACGERSTEGGVDYPGVIRLYDFGSGRQVRELRGHLTAVASVHFSPTGKTLISRGQTLDGLRTGAPGESETKFVRVWDVATGKELQVSIGGGQHIEGMALSPNGRTVASISSGRKITLWETITGDRRAELVSHADFINAFAFSPDGRTLASAGAYDGVVCLWDLPSGVEIGRLEGHRGRVHALAFAPDSRTLVSGGADTTALVWDVTRFTKRHGRILAPQATDLESSWKELADDAAAGYRAIGRMVSSPDSALSLLRKYLRPAVELDAKQVARLVRELDSDRFQAREQATKEFEELGEIAIPALQKALADNPPLEVKRRLAELMDKLNTSIPSRQTVRQIRAVEALETMGSPEACELLKTLIGGVPRARLTQEAAASLRRLRAPKRG